MTIAAEQVALRLSRNLDKKALGDLDETTLREAVDTVCVTGKFHYSVGARWILRNLNIFARLSFSQRDFILNYQGTQHVANAFMCDARMLMYLHPEERLPFVESAYLNFGIPETDNPITLVHAMLDAGVAPNEIVEMFGRCIEKNKSLPPNSNTHPANDFLRVLSSRHGESDYGHWFISPKEFTQRAGKETIKRVLIQATDQNPNLLLQYPIIAKRFLEPKELTKSLQASAEKITTLRYVSLRTIKELKQTTLLRLLLNLRVNKGWKTNTELFQQACTWLLLGVPEEYLERTWNSLSPVYTGKLAVDSLRNSIEILEESENQTRAKWIQHALEVEALKHDWLFGKAKIGTYQEKTQLRISVGNVLYVSKTELAPGVKAGELVCFNTKQFRQISDRVFSGKMIPLKPDSHIRATVNANC